LTTPELKHALTHNHLLKIFDAVIYQQARIFTRYVDKFYQLRREFAAAGDELFAHFCKLLLNSLYGKFGQKAEVWTKIGDAPGETNRIEDGYDSVKKKYTRIRYLLGEVFELEGLEETRHSFPGIAAHVTAYARAYLWYLMERAGPGNYFYCDTDSLIVNDQGLENLASLLSDTELGMLKVEGTYQQITIHGLKDYVLPTKTVIKGIRKNAVRVDDQVYRQDRWPSLKGLLRDNVTSVYRTETVTKVLDRQYRKGFVNQDGTVTPYVLDERPQLF